jgi:5-formyltetrahydrofolate cyclo-ligase
MPSNSKNPQAANLGALLKGLKEAGVDFILVGGVAAVAQGLRLPSGIQNICSQP